MSGDWIVIDGFDRSLVVDAADGIGADLMSAITTPGEAANKKSKSPKKKERKREREIGLT